MGLSIAQLLPIPTQISPWYLHCASGFLSLHPQHGGVTVGHCSSEFLISPSNPQAIPKHLVNNGHPSNSPHARPSPSITAKRHTAQHGAFAHSRGATQNRSGERTWADGGDCLGDDGVHFLTSTCTNGIVKRSYFPAFW